eukprot:3503036-Karenia_brevis.AAC.1
MVDANARSPPPDFVHVGPYGRTHSSPNTAAFGKFVMERELMVPSTFERLVDTEADIGTYFWDSSRDPVRIDYIMCQLDVH